MGGGQPTFLVAVCVLVSNAKKREDSIYLFIFCYRWSPSDILFICLFVCREVNSATKASEHHNETCIHPVSSRGAVCYEMPIHSYVGCGRGWGWGGWKDGWVRG